MSIVLGKHRFIPEDELEATIETLLRSCGLYPTVASPVVDLDCLIEQHLKADIDHYYSDLADAELGVTHFRPGCRPKVLINRLVTEAADSSSARYGIFGRWRFTIAHEAAHIVFHRDEIESAFLQLSLFGEQLFHFDPFYGEDNPFSAQASPREWQANRGASAILMPRSLFRQIAEPQVRSIDISPGENLLTSQAFDRLLTELAICFHVSRQAARIRFETLGLATTYSQRTFDV